MADEDRRRTEVWQGRQSEWVSRFARFAGAGAVGTAAHYLVFATWVQLAGSHVVVATMAGFLVGAVINYTLNYHITFASKQGHIAALPKFMSIAAIGFCINAALVAAGMGLGLYYMVSQVLATLVVLAWNFLANSLWTFKG